MIFQYFIASCKFFSVFLQLNLFCFCVDTGAAVILRLLQGFFQLKVNIFFLGLNQLKLIWPFFKLCFHIKHLIIKFSLSLTSLFNSQVDFLSALEYVVFIQRFNLTNKCISRRYLLSQLLKLYFLRVHNNFARKTFFSKRNNSFLKSFIIFKRYQSFYVGDRLLCWLINRVFRPFWMLENTADNFVNFLRRQKLVV